MRFVIGAMMSVTLAFAAAPEAQAQVGFWYAESSGYVPVYGSAFYASPPLLNAPIYYGGWGPGWGGWAYPGYLGGVGYHYSYYTHLPGYSFTYFTGRIPRYYPGPLGANPFGGLGYYGYGPLGWWARRATAAIGNGVIGGGVSEGFLVDDGIVGEIGAAGRCLWHLIRRALEQP
jgi:hypothetical protein